MGSGGSAVDAMVIGCLGVERRAERFLSYLAILFNLFFLSSYENLTCRRDAELNTQHSVQYSVFSIQ
jgi:hypothetical protein